MTLGWHKELTEMAGVHGVIVRVSLIQADGSTPCGIGAAMTVAAETFTGTVGGGALEHEALKAARTMLSAHAGGNKARWRRAVRDYPLGPSLGQCCGGYVRLLFEVVSAPEMAEISDTLADVSEVEKVLAVRPLKSGLPMRFCRHRKDDHDDWPLSVRRVVRGMMSGTKSRAPVVCTGWYIEPMGPARTALFLYGAGHVGRAVVKALEGLAFDIYWVDTAANRYPDEISPGVRQLIANNPSDIVRHAPADAFHVVMTFSHAIDFDICRAVLAKGDFAYLGVIASKTKRTRFVRRLKESGISEAAVRRLHAPIGLAGLDGKEPPIIAVSLAADLLLRLQEKQTKVSTPEEGKEESRMGEGS